MYNSTLKHEEKIVTKVELIVKMIVKYLEAYIKSQCMYLNPLLETS